MKKFLSMVVAVFMILTTMALPVFAAEIRVTNMDELTQAVSYAANANDGTTIVLAAGEYQGLGYSGNTIRGKNINFKGEDGAIVDCAYDADGDGCGDGVYMPWVTGTIENIVFTDNGKDIQDYYYSALIFANDTNMGYPCDLEIRNCDFITTYANNSGIHFVGDVDFYNCDFVGNNSYSAMNYCCPSGDGIVIDNCKFSGNYAFASIHLAEGAGADTVISNCDIKVGYMEFGSPKNITFTNNKINSTVNLWSENNVVFDGNDFGSDALISANSSDSVASILPNNTYVDGKTVNDIIASGSGVNGSAAPSVAELNGAYYGTLQDAITAAKDNDVVCVLPGTYEEELVINKSIVITGNPNYGASTFATRAAIEKPVIKISDVTNGGVEYHAPNVTFDNIVFEVAEDATGSGWNVSALGYYYETVADREGLKVTNCDFINNSDISLGAIAANIGKYTITNNTFTNFAIGVWSFVDHGAADEIVVSDNTFANVANLVNIYHGAAADGSANVTISNNKATDGSETQISVIDFGQEKATPATAYDNVVITGNDAEVVLGNYAKASFDATVENNNSVVYTYESEAILKALEAAGVPSGDVYVNYGTDKEVMYKVVNGAVYGAAESLEVKFELASDVEGEKIYNINLKANEEGIINRLNSADLTFLFTPVEGANEFEIIASNEEVAINAVDNSKVRYEFHYNGKDNVLTDTDTVITIGQVKFTGYGKFSFAVDSAVDTNAAHSTTMMDNIVDTFVPNGDITAGEGELDIDDNTITDVVIAVPDRNLGIKIDFPNAVVDNAIAYQDMKVVISGGDLAEDITIDLGEDAQETALDIFGKVNAKYAASMVDGSYVINVTDALTVNNAYTVTVSGAGYRTARYTVTMTDDKQLNFWNNVMDEAQVVEIGKDSSVAKVTFLAGDIVKDNKINIYDLSAVVSYFGTENLKADYPQYAKYDLNRDNVIDSKDVAYVLVSWGE